MSSKFIRSHTKNNWSTLCAPSRSLNPERLGSQGSSKIWIVDPWVILKHKPFLNDLLHFLMSFKIQDEDFAIYWKSRILRPCGYFNLTSCTQFLVGSKHNFHPSFVTNAVFMSLNFRISNLPEDFGVQIASQAFIQKGRLWSAVPHQNRRTKPSIFSHNCEGNRKVCIA